MVTRTATPHREGRARSERGANCRHHWMIDAAEGRTSSGECLFCQERRTFPNYLSDCLIESDTEKFGEWVAKQSRKKPKSKSSWDVLSEIEEGV